MKNLINIAAAVLLLLAAATTKAAGNGNPSDTSDFIVNGLIIQKNKKIDQRCKLELFYENSMIDSSNARVNKPFEFKLKKNVWYTIRVTKEGYVPLLISFNTEVNKGDTVIDNLFAFETELIDLNQAKYMDKDLLDFPVGLVSLNKTTGNFEARDLYTQNYMIGLAKPTPEIPTLKEYVTKQDTKNDQTPDITKEYVVHRNVISNMV